MSETVKWIVLAALAATSCEASLVLWTNRAKSTRARTAWFVVGMLANFLFARIAGVTR